MIMLTAFTSTLTVGAVMVGGIDAIRDVMNTHKIRLSNFSPNPTVRISFWSCFIGGTFIGLSAVASNQQMIQRFLTCKTERQAKNAVWLGFLCIAVVDVIAVGTGVVMYVYYQGCDPYTSGKVASPDQLMPYFTVDLFSEVYGLSGLLVFSVFSASLSAVSSQLNSLANMTGYGVVKQIWPKIGPVSYAVTIKVFVIIYGCCAIGIAFVAACSKSLLQMTFSVIGITTGPLLGVLSLGILYPHGNSKGAISGIIVSVLFGLWLQIGALVYPPDQYQLPLSTDMCDVIDINGTAQSHSMERFTSATKSAGNVSQLFIGGINHTDGDEYVSYSIMLRENVAMTTTDVSHDQISRDYPPFALFYSISYLYYGFLTWCLAFSVGVLVSHLHKSEAFEPIDSTLVATVSDTYLCCITDGQTQNPETESSNEVKNYKFPGLILKSRRLPAENKHMIHEIEPLNENETEV